MPSTFLDLLRTKVAIQLGLLDAAAAQAGLQAVDGGRPVLEWLAQDRGLSQDVLDRIDRHARRCEFLKGESFYLRLLRSRNVIDEQALQPIAWEVRTQPNGQSLGENLIARGMLQQALHTEMMSQVQQALIAESTQITARYRERGYAGIERPSPAVAQVIQEEQKKLEQTAQTPAPTAPGPGVEGTQILSQEVASGQSPLTAIAGRDPEDAERTQDLPEIPAVAAPPLPAELLNTGLDQRYTVVKKAGEGGMGAVYLAFAKDDTERSQPMALKIVQGAAKTKDAAARFKREILATSFCAHENIIEIYDANETDDGSYYMAMEFIEGDELADLIKQIGPLPLPRVVELIDQALQGLQAIHGANIVHRDIKPQNFRVYQDAEGRERLKIMDFGIARVLDAEDSGAGDQFFKTMGGKITGSPAYIAPESITEPEVDGRADLYSLGISIFRVATGRLPFVAKEPTEYLPMHLYQQPPKLRSILPDAPVEMEEFVSKLLEKVRDRRFASAGAALDFLREKVRPKVIPPEAPAAAAAPGQPAGQGHDALGFTQNPEGPATGMPSVDLGFTNPTLPVAEVDDLDPNMTMLPGYLEPVQPRAPQPAAPPQPTPPVAEATPQAPQPEEPPKKKGFFAWLFGT